VGVIQALSSTLKLHPLNELNGAEASASSLELRFTDGSHFEFPAKSKEHAEQAKAALSLAQEKVSEAEREESIRDLAALDPLCNTRFPSPFSTGVPFKRPAMAWTAALFGMALVSGSALGVGVWKIRNIMSEGRIAASAQQLGSAEAFRKYLERGGTRQDIIDVHLPRAELAAAVAQGGVEPIERYVAEHPDSKIPDEVAEALRVALLAELESAKAKGTLAALNDFAAHFPRHEPVERELAQARHAVYEHAADHAVSLTVDRPSKRNDPAEFMRRLVSYAEKSGPKMEVRFRGQLNKTAKRADDDVRKHPYFGGKLSLPSQYFDAEHMHGREALAGPLLIDALQSLFAHEVVRVEAGAALPTVGAEDDAPELPEPAVPTLYIHHLTELSGGQTHNKPRGFFVSSAITFYTDFVIPGDDYRLSFKISTWRAPDRKVMDNDQRTFADVYEDMARRSFSIFLSRYLALVLRDPPDATLPRIELPEDDDKQG
jgi:hypothetical protein